MPSRRTKHLWAALGIIATGVGILVSFQTLGMPMPWQDSPQQISAQAQMAALTKRVSDLELGMQRMEGKLDLAIDLLLKK